MRPAPYLKDNARMSEEEHKIYVDEMKKTIAETIHSVVNGKINTIDRKITEYIAQDLVWKEDKVEPLIEAHQTILNLATFIKWTAGVIASTIVIWKVLTFQNNP